MGKISYSSLVKKYDNFITPAMVVKVNGKKVNTMEGIYISHVNVSLYLDKVCSADLSLEMVYDLEKSIIDSQVKKIFQLGSGISIEMGYGSATEVVFYGYIHELQYAFSETVSIKVTALDMRRLMMMNKENRTFSDKSYSDIFEEVIQKYSNVYQSKKVESTTEKIERVTQDVSDYDFVVKELCQKANKEFYVMAGKVFFQDKEKSTPSQTTLTWGENLFQFQIRRKYCNEQIVVYGVNEKEIVTGTETVESQGDYKNAIGKPTIYEILSTDAKDQKSAEAIAKKEAKKKKKSSKSGTGSCFGLPELVPGDNITIEKLGIESSDLTGTLVSVTHSFGENGFTTDFELGG